MMLGNLSIEEIEERTNVTFPDTLKEFMETTRQEDATNVAPGKWHCFDIPFALVCGDEVTATVIYNDLVDLQGNFKDPLQIFVNTSN